MLAERSSPTPELLAALTETFGDPLRTQVYIAIYERPGATVSQVARRLDQPARRVRHQVDLLTRAGLVVVDGESAVRNTRERHHRAVVVPSVDSHDDPWPEESRRRMNLSIMKFISADIARAIRHRTFAARAGHAEARVPGEVDERGWSEIEATLEQSMERFEGVMTRSAERLAAAASSGIEAFCTLVLFEARPWERSTDGPQGPRPSHWAPAAPGTRPLPGPAWRPRPGVPPSSADLREAMVAALEDQLRAHVLLAVVDRPGATIGQIANRIGEPPRRVRHQIERLLDAGLIVADVSETPRRNAGERHYLGVVLPTVEEGGADWGTDQWRKIALSIIRVIMADLDGALGGRTFGTRAGHSVIRIAGEVDERGWEELAAGMVATTVEIEKTMVGSAARLAEAGAPGREVLSALLLLESPPWDPGEGERSGPRPSQWHRK